MSNLFMIGNGFDLACGLKTQYTDVYKEYVQTGGNSDIIKRFKNDIQKDYCTWADFEMGMAAYAKTLESEAELIECVRDFRRFLLIYLKAQQSSLDSCIKNLYVLDEIREEMNRSIGSFYSTCTQNAKYMASENNELFGGNNSFVSFNYTDVFDRLLFSSQSSETTHNLLNIFKVIHIHGSIKNTDCTLGVDNETQIDLDYKLSESGKRAFIKPFFNQSFDSKRIDVVMNL